MFGPIYDVNGDEITYEEYVATLDKQHRRQIRRQQKELEQFLDESLGHTDNLPFYY